MKTQREIRFEITKQSFLKALKDANYKLKSEYIDCAEKVLVEPPCGHKPYWVSPASFKAGRRCQKCHIENMRVVRTIESRKRFKAKVEAEVTGHEGECSEGVTDVYTAEGEVTVGKVTYKYTATNKVKQEVGEHSYTAEFTWTPNEDEKLYEEYAQNWKLALEAQQRYEREMRAKIKQQSNSI